MNLLIPLTAEEQSLAEAYAKAHFLSLEEAFKKALFRHISAEAPNQITRSAIQEMDKDMKNPVLKTYDSFDEVLEELDSKEIQLNQRFPYQGGITMGPIKQKHVDGFIRQASMDAAEKFSKDLPDVPLEKIAKAIRRDSQTIEHWLIAIIDYHQDITDQSLQRMAVKLKGAGYSIAEIADAIKYDSYTADRWANMTPEELWVAEYLNRKSAMLKLETIYTDLDGIKKELQKMDDITKTNQETDYLMLSKANRKHILKGITEAQDPLAQLSLNKRKGYAEGKFEGRVESTANLIKAGLTTFDAIKESDLFTESELTAISIKLFKNA